ncbi:MAG TPA: CapA family protein [Sphingobium sp.]
MIDRRNFLTGAGATVTMAATPSFAKASSALRIALLGDCLFTQGLNHADPNLAPLLPILRGADLTVANFEGTLADMNAWAAAIAPDGTPVCGGMNIRGDESVAGDLSGLGIDMLGTANNHAWDWGPDGIMATIRKLTAAGLRPTGTGKDLAAARNPSFCTVKGVRVALIACASTFWTGTLASSSSAQIPGRPGVNPLRFRMIGEGDGAQSSVDPADLKDLTAVVRSARAEADIVLISCHTHESEGDRTNPPAFLRQFARACIDAGASAFFSHGPHVLRGIDLYRGVPIFYSLGAFIFRAREMRAQPEEAYDVCGIAERTPEAYFKHISKGWDEDSEFWESVIAQVEIRAGGVVGVTLTPTIIQHAGAENWGMPALADETRGRAILARLQRLSDSFGTKIMVSGTTGQLQL